MIRTAEGYWQLNSGMRMVRGACHMAIAVEMRQEGFAGFKPSVCRLTIVELHRMEREAVALHEWLAIIGNPVNGPLASGNPAALDDAVEWAAARLADIRRATR